MKIPASAAGRLAEFFKTNRKDTSDDILVNSGIKEIKKGNNKGEMVALYRASNSENKFAMLKNAFLGRTPADRSDVLNLLKTSGNPCFSIPRYESNGNHFLIRIPDELTTQPSIDVKRDSQANQTEDIRLSQRRKVMENPLY